MKKFCVDTNNGGIYWSMGYNGKVEEFYTVNLVGTATINEYKRVLSEEWEELPEMLMTSSVTGFGRDAVLGRIDEINQILKNNKEQE